MFGLPMVVLLAAACAGLSVPIMWWSVAAPDARDGVRDRLRVDNDLRELVLANSGGERLIEPGMARLARIGRALSPVGMVDRLDRKIVLAGMSRQWPLDRVLGAKLVLGVFFALIMLIRWSADPSNVRLLLMSIIIAAGAFMLPDILIGIRGAKRQEEIARSLPDILDQVTISVEAGLGFDSAIAHVAHNVDGPLSAELAHMLQDVKLGMSRAHAFENLTERTDVQELRQFVLALNQAEKLGVPIAQVLRVQSSELRTIRRQTAEEAAQKVPVKMIIPLVLFILPALIIVVLAPAIFDVMDTFG
jgi:tight adherence protein C